MQYAEIMTAYTSIVIYDCTASMRFPLAAAVYAVNHTGYATLA
jgi:hypothetical protein